MFFSPQPPYSELYVVLRNRIDTSTRTRIIKIFSHNKIMFTKSTHNTIRGLLCFPYILQLNYLNAGGLLATSPTEGE